MLRNNTRNRGGDHIQLMMHCKLGACMRPSWLRAACMVESAAPPPPRGIATPHIPSIGRSRVVLRALHLCKAF